MNSNGSNDLLIGYGMDASGKRPRSDVVADEGYFKRLRVGDPEYLMPLADGALDQVITANGDGTSEWKEQGSGVLKRGGQFNQTYYADINPIGSGPIFQSLFIGANTASAKTSGTLSCIALGQFAGGSGGDSSIAIGDTALNASLTASSRNIAVGAGSGSTITGSNNVAIGVGSATAVVAGSNNTFIGDNSQMDVAFPNGDYAIAIGSGAVTVPRFCTFGPSDAGTALVQIRPGRDDATDLGDKLTRFRNHHCMTSHMSEGSYFADVALPPVTSAGFGSVYNQDATAPDEGLRWYPEGGGYTVSGRGAKLVAGQVNSSWGFNLGSVITPASGVFGANSLVYASSVPTLGLQSDPDFGTFVPDPLGTPPAVPGEAGVRWTWNGPRVIKIKVDLSFVVRLIIPPLQISRFFTLRKNTDPGGGVVQIATSHVSLEWASLTQVVDNAVMLSLSAHFSIEPGRYFFLNVEERDTTGTSFILRDLTCSIVELN
jgi:hypothetical protein